ncbi:DivIVA domain-containing protein [Micromonospora sp. NPDC049230]|uniref:DivIVA domain-containing protein n=1 Tax=Micromonospora sp. NPDC049230 TaxID=3155502 RepID=UPI0033ECE8C2
MSRSTRYDGSRLHPRHVRDRQFATVGFGRRGLDPAEVRRFLHRVALDLTVLHQDLALLSAENARVKRALRAWHGAGPDGRRP